MEIFTTEITIVILIEFGILEGRERLPGGELFSTHLGWLYKP